MQQPQTIFTDPEVDEKPPKKQRVVKLPKITPPPRETHQTVPQDIPRPVREKATKEIQTDQLIEQEKQRQKIRNLVENSRTVLFKCKAVFPFDLFPDEITIEPTQVNVSKRYFFLSARSNSIPIKNLADAIIHTAPFFASLTLIDQNFAENSVTVSYLSKKDAEIARRIVQGLIVMSKEGVDLSTVDVATLRKEVVNIGQMQAIKQV